MFAIEKSIHLTLLKGSFKKYNDKVNFFCKIVENNRSSTLMIFAFLNEECNSFVLDIYLIISMFQNKMGKSAA